MRILPWALGVVLVGAIGCAQSAEPPTTTTLPPATEPSPPPTTSPVPGEVTEGTTTTTTEAITLETPQAPIEAVVAREDGLWLLLTSGTQVRLWDFPTAVGFVLGQEVVVAQAASAPTDLYPPPKEGPVLILDRDGLERLDPPDGFSEIRLHDAGFLDERPVVLVTVASRSDPEAAEERLLLWDLGTEEWVDLGVSGGWEAGVGQARLTDSGVVASVFGEGEGGGWIEGRVPDGSVIWQSEPGTGDGSVAWSSQTGETLVLRAGFIGDDFLPVLYVRAFAEDGSETRQATLELVLPERLSIEGGFCTTAEVAPSGVLCDQTYGGPILIDFQSADVRPYGELEQGVVTLIRHAR